MLLSARKNFQVRRYEAAAAPTSHAARFSIGNAMKKKKHFQSGNSVGNGFFQRERKTKQSGKSESQQDSAEGERGDGGWTLLLFMLGKGESADFTFCGVTVSDSLAAWKEPNSFTAEDC